MKQVWLTYDWYDVPDEAKYVAQDGNGQWFSFHKEPTTIDVGGMEDADDFIWDKGGRMFYVAHTAPPKDYTQELYELVDEE